MLSQIYFSNDYLKNISSIVFDNHNYLYFSNSGLNSPYYSNIFRIDLNNNIIQLTNNTNSSINYVGLYFYNNKIYTTTFNNFIYTLDLTNYSIHLLALLDNNTLNIKSIGICLDNVENVYVSTQLNTISSCNGHVYKIIKKENNKSIVFIHLDYFIHPQYITIDSDNNVYISDIGKKSVLKCNSSGIIINEFFINNVSFSSILFHNNYFYCSNQNKNSITKCNIEGIIINENFIIGGQTILGGGIAFDNFHNFYVSNEFNFHENDKENKYTTILMVKMYEPLCFNKGCKILCLNKKYEEKYKNVEKLKIGNIIKTYKHGYRKITFIHKNILKNNPENYIECMYKLPKNTVIDGNTCFEDFIITGNHSILVNNILKEIKEEYKQIFKNKNIQKIDDKYLLQSFISKDFEKITDNNIYIYYHFVLENDDNNDRQYGVWCNGILTETLNLHFYPF
jgi:hypothetical protein